MKGIIESVYHFSEMGFNNGSIKSIWITGEDGQRYFGHHTQFAKKRKHYKKGRTVTFEPVQGERAHPEADNIDVEVPENPNEVPDTLLFIRHLPDGAYVKHIQRGKNQIEVCMLIKERTVILTCLPEYERDMIWIYQRGPSGIMNEV